MEGSLHERSSRQVKSLFSVAVNLLYMYSTACVYVNRKTRIKRAKNRMQLQIKKNRAHQKNRTCVHDFKITHPYNCYFKTSWNLTSSLIQPIRFTYYERAMYLSQCSTVSLSAIIVCTVHNGHCMGCVFCMTETTSIRDQKKKTWCECNMSVIIGNTFIIIIINILIIQVY